MPSAQLVAVTKPIESMTAEQFIAHAARVSNPNNQNNHDTAPKLLKYLVQHGHWSPFEMVHATMKITTSRAIMAQILRHWSFRFQEFSMRYSEASEQEPLEIRKKHVDGNRQGSGEFCESLTFDAGGSVEDLVGYYGYLLTHGAAPESARMVLPLNTTTTAYMVGSVRSWMTYFWQRLDPHAQKEHRELGDLLFVEFSKEFPQITTMILAGRPQYVEGDWASLEPTSNL